MFPVFMNTNHRTDKVCIARKVSFLGNPFYIQAIIWMVVVSIYSLEWSDLYPKISLELLIFLGASVDYYFIFGFFVKEKGTGFCVPLKDTDAFGKSIERLFRMTQEEYEEMQYNCRNIAQQMHSYKAFINNFENQIN